MKTLLFLIFYYLSSSLIEGKLLYILTGGVTYERVRFNAYSNTGGQIEITFRDTKNKYDPDDLNYYDMEISGLQPNTEYLFEFKHEDSTLYRKVKTFPTNGTKGIYYFIASCYIRSDTSSFAYNKIVQNYTKTISPSLFMLLGDIHTDDINSDSLKEHEESFHKGN